MIEVEFYHSLINSNNRERSLRWPFSQPQLLFFIGCASKCSKYLIFKSYKTLSLSHICIQTAALLMRMIAHYIEFSTRQLGYLRILCDQSINDGQQGSDAVVVASHLASCSHLRGTNSSITTISNLLPVVRLMLFQLQLHQFLDTSHVDSRVQVDRLLLCFHQTNKLFFIWLGITGNHQVEIRQSRNTCIGIRARHLLVIHEVKMLSKHILFRR